MRKAVDERRDVGRAAHFVQLACARELLFQRDEVDGVAALAELHHLFEDAAMGIAKKIARVQDFSGRIERVVVDQNRAEDGTLGFEVVR